MSSAHLATLLAITLAAFVLTFVATEDGAESAQGLTAVESNYCVSSKSFARYNDGALTQSHKTSADRAYRQMPLIARHPAVRSTQILEYSRAHARQIVVKFKDGSSVRVRNGKVTRIAEAAPEIFDRLARTGLDVRRIDADTIAVNRIAAAQKAQFIRLGELSPGAQANESDLDALRRRGEALSGRELADLNTYAYMVLPVADIRRASKVVAELRNLASVEVAYTQPIPVSAMDIPPETTIDFTGFGQGFQGAAPMGIELAYAREFSGASGQGVRVIDVEYGWRLDHEDLPPKSRLIFSHGDMWPREWGEGELDHGTAVLGMLWAEKNGFGIDGMIPDAELGVSSPVFFRQSCSGSVADFVYSVPLAMLSATPVLREGDILLIEQQYVNAAGYTPIESSPLEFDTIQLLTAQGIIVVEAAGNGKQRVDRTSDDSGAIMVGARQATVAGPTWFTNFGSRVDVHAWGESIATLGYGGSPDAVDQTLRANGDDPLQWYTTTFGGTSGASPIVVAAAAIIQSTRAAIGLPKLYPSQMRELLVSSGTPAQGEIGTQPNLRAAMATYLPARAADANTPR